MTHRVALLIEDDRLTAAVIGDWLTQAGWSVDHLTNGGLAMARFAELRPELVVTDLVLPGVDGTTLCANMRLEPFGAALVLVVISARAQAREAALAAGADEFFAKPVDREAFLAAIARPRPAIEEPPESGAPSPVRVPSARALGVAVEAPLPEEGGITPGMLPELLRRLQEQRFTGVLEADGVDASGESLRVKLFFHRGIPSAARSSDASTEFGGVLERLGVLSPSRLANSVEEGRRSGVPLGEVLIRSRLIERRAVERALREQVLVRAVGIGRLVSGRTLVSHADPMGLAGFDVHPAAIVLRLDPAAGEAPAEADRDLHVRVQLSPGQWALLDPDGGLGVARALVVGGASVRDCMRVGGEPVGRLLGLLRAYEAVTLSEVPPLASQREAGLAELDVEALSARISDRHRALSDANHYTVLGVHPDADAEDISVATMAALAACHSDALPAALDAEARRRAQAIYDRVLEAGRVLGDPVRRGIYDARLSGDALVRVGEIGLEDFAVLQAERARELFRRGEYVTAAALFYLAIQLEGEAADILAMLGWARHRACPEDRDAGEIELRRSLLLEPEDEFTLYYLGRLLGDRGEMDEGRRLLRAALAKNHEFEPARDALRELDP